MSKSNNIVFKNGSMSIELSESQASVDLVWSGRSIDRDPGLFLMPIFTEVQKRCQGGKIMTLHFEKLEYMNSSTITPIIRMMHKVKSERGSLRIVYAKALKWQELSFSALQSLESGDGRVEVVGT